MIDPSIPVLNNINLRLFLFYLDNFIHIINNAFLSKNSATHVSTFMSIWIHFICFKSPSQTFKPVKVNRSFSKRTVKIIFKQGLAKYFFHPWVFILFYNSFETVKVGKGGKWLSNLSLEQS